MENTTKGLDAEQHQQLLFMMLIQQHEQIAGMGLGRIPNPVTNKTEMDLQSAKYAIDTLMMLQTFTKGNISNDMNEFLEQTLTRLRIDYARAVSDAKRKTADSRKPDAGNTDASQETDAKAGSGSGRAGSGDDPDGKDSAQNTAATDQDSTAQPGTTRAGKPGKSDPS
ncbi:MAG: DUF1844 domain-containing protein [Rhodothermaceae bacterium]|nr:DUF1844 domain-containing protein [Rhodothermaceae bacterium]